MHPVFRPRRKCQYRNSVLQSTRVRVAAQRIVDGVRSAEAMSTSTPNVRNPVMEPNTQFWAYLISPGGINGLFWSWVGVVHDHRDNSPQASGYSFSVFHPGSALPQAPFGI
jgi:hypothetical protein